MNIDMNNEKPIYLQLSEAIEDNILKDIFQEETQIPSTNEMAVMFKINPATARKGMNLLVEQGIIYKKRGVGMFVYKGAKDRILTNRKESFYEDFIKKLLDEAAKLNISKNDIIRMIERSE